MRPTEEYAGHRRDAGAVLLLLAVGLALSSYTLHSIPANGLNAEKLLPLDDAYIHLTFARSIAREGQMAFRPGKVVPAVTAPLWTLLLGLSHVFVGRLDWLALGWGVVGYLLCALLMYRVGSHLFHSRGWGWFGAFCILANGRMLWALASGMEIALCAFFVLWGFYSFVLDARRGRRGWWTAFLFALAANLRPEVHLLFLLALALRAFSIERAAPGRYRIAWTGQGRSLLGAVGIYVLLQLPYALFCLFHYGRLFPTTYYSKQLVSEPIVWPYLGDFVTWLVLSLGPLFLFCLVGVGVSLRRSVENAEGRAMLLPVLWLFTFPLAQAIKNPAMVNHGRYLMPFLPLWGVLALVGMKACFGWVRDNRWEIRWGGRLVVLRKAKGVFLALVLLFCALFFGGSALMGQRALQDDYRSMAEWINTARHVRRNLAPDAKLAVHDVGALSYLTANPLFDLEGLLSPEVALLRADPDMPPEEKERRIVRRIQRAGCKYLVIHRWYRRRIASLPAELMDEGREGQRMSVWKILPPPGAPAETG